MRRHAIALATLWTLSFCSAQAPVAGTAPFVFDGNRVYADLAFIRPDGSLHRALAFVDMGSPTMSVTSALFKELQLDRRRSLSVRIGDLPIAVPAKAVTPDLGEAFSVGSDSKVEAVLPASVLEKYEVVLDYQSRKLTLALPGTIKPEGTAVPFRIHPQTGLIAVDALIAGKTYSVTIDNGSAYTWFRQDAAKPWLEAHPEWERGVGAVGAANMMMSGSAAETEGILVHVPEIEIGPMKLKDVGVLAAAPSNVFGNHELFDWYSAKNAAPVIGWIGGNVLKSFCLTIDYPNRKMYWQRIAPDAYDLDQVGITLRAGDGKYLVAAVATQKGKATVEGLQPGDQLVRIGELATKDATWGQIYEALRGTPGERKILLIERGGKQITVSVPVTAF